MEKNIGNLIINEYGNGFVNLNNNISIYINKKDLQNAFNGEMVEVEYYKKDDLYYGKVINYSLLGKTFIGKIHHFYLDEIFIYCNELKKNNLISIKTSFNLSKNDWVFVKIVSTLNNKLYGEFIECLSNNIDDIIEKKFNLTNLDDISNNVTGVIKNNHINQTHLDTFTIDPENTRDCDDAFSVEIINNDIKIYVHISDVAHWINPNMQLFDEIVKRGNTFYGKNKNWSMIPRKYADYYCSILPDKETYVVTNEFIYNKETASLNYIKWYYSIIKSKNKYNYDYVDNNFNDIRFQIIYDTSLIIKNDIPDFNIVDETKSHKMVKYWMIKINQIMSNIIKKIYRCNIKPQDNKFELLKNYVEYHRININFNRNEIIDYIDKNPTKLNYYIIKSLLTKAYYYTDNKLHYGLGIDNYTHWTSPIRRACDLLNHCILKNYDIDISQYIKYMNEMELKQDLIEKFIIDFDNYQNIKLGDIFVAIIIKINNNGIIVYIDYFNDKFSLHISKLSNDKDNKLLYKLFDIINVKIIKIDFGMLEFSL